METSVAILSHGNHPSQRFMTKQGLAARVKVKVLGVLGGSGLYDPSFLDGVREKGVKTPFGLPSDKLQMGKPGGLDVVFLPRHGRKHTIPSLTTQ